MIDALNLLCPLLLIFWSIRFFFEDSRHKKIYDKGWQEGYALGLKDKPTEENKP